ncbi:hypothetical protein [uncultured Oscillibacter sp.]|uniref:hypothetical protein n=1 Tax=uncultured Oscillibacter sp. TaxID=876091 RepID=UPI0025EAAC9F|nr:hypothetical protein [uncultured Oscillibacter sp.]
MAHHHRHPDLLLLRQRQHLGVRLRLRKQLRMRLRMREQLRLRLWEQLRLRLQRYLLLIRPAEGGREAPFLQP